MGPLVRLARWGRRNPVLVASLGMVFGDRIGRDRDDPLAVAQRGRSPATVRSGRQVRALEALSFEHLGCCIGGSNCRTTRHGTAGAGGYDGRASQLGVATPEESLDDSLAVMAGTPTDAFLRRPIISPSGDQVAVVDKDAPCDQSLGNGDR